MSGFETASLQFTGFLGAAYPWVKAAHVTFVIFWLAGLFLTGITLIVIGILLGEIGRSARKAEMPPAEAQDQVEMTVERHWVVGDTALAAWHASYVQRTNRARVRLAGFMTLELAGGGRIRRFREWWHRRETLVAG